ncbi:MAG: S8 family serine peptidase [Pseudomonadales bacterium]
MKTYYATFLVWLVAGWLIASQVQSAPQGPQLVDTDPDEVSRLFEGQREVHWVPGQVIVKYKTAAAPADAVSQLRAMEISDHVTTTSGGEYIYTLPPRALSALSARKSEQRIMSAVEAMEERGDVEYVQPNYILQIVRTPDDPGFPSQWHYFDQGTGSGKAPGGVGLPAAWDTSIGDPNVVIAVIDTGILPNHPDISGSANLAAGFDMITNTFTANDGNARDNDPTDPGDATEAGECGPGSRAQPDSWHGTHVAGTTGVGQTDNGTGVAGVNWRAKVQSIRALGKCGGSIADINDAIRWAAGLPVPQVPPNRSPAKVINMSLGAGAPCSASPATQAAIDDVVQAGVTVVVAAGNEAQDAANAFPASCDNVITVAASDYNGKLVTRYSNFGEAVDIMAPGGDVQEDVDNDGNPDGVLSMVQGGYAFYNGTSMAAPHVAGVVGLLLAEDQSLTPQQVTERIKGSALPRSRRECPRPCGAGLLAASIGPVQEDPTELSVSPDSIRFRSGDTEVLSATVTRGGSPAEGEMVSFASSDTSLVTIEPASGITDTNGSVQATVTAAARGTAQIEIAVANQSQTTPVDVEVRVVPTLGLAALALLIAILSLILYRFRQPTMRAK